MKRRNNKAGIVVATPTRTTEPKRRMRIDSSMELIRSSASSSWISMSALRVTRNA
jgi:hypothetical protein